MAPVVGRWPTKVRLQPARWDKHLVCAATVRHRRSTVGKGLARETHLRGGCLLMHAIQLLTAAAFQ